MAFGPNTFPGPIDQIKDTNPATRNILAEAWNLVHGQRQQDYGDKLTNFQHIADLWNATLKFKLLPTAKISPEDVAICMMQVKIARLVKSPHHEDSQIDIAGYIACYNLLRMERDKYSRNQNSVGREPSNGKD